jgi:hypothetical protein
LDQKATFFQKVEPKATFWKKVEQKATFWKKVGPKGIRTKVRKNINFTVIKVKLKIYFSLRRTIFL